MGHARKALPIFETQALPETRGQGAGRVFLRNIPTSAAFFEFGRRGTSVAKCGSVKATKPGNDLPNRREVNGNDIESQSQW